MRNRVLLTLAFAISLIGLSLIFNPLSDSYASAGIATSQFEGIKPDYPIIPPLAIACEQPLELEYGTNDISRLLRIEKPIGDECGGGFKDLVSPDRVLVFNTPGGGTADPENIKLWSDSALARGGIINHYDGVLHANGLCTQMTRVCVGARVLYITTLGKLGTVYLWRKASEGDPIPTPTATPTPIPGPTGTPAPRPSFVQPSVVVIKKNNTGTNTTEVHVLSGPDTFQRFNLNTGTAQPSTGDEHVYRVADWDRDGRPDMFAIKKNATGTGSTEVHILSGGENFQRFLLHTGTPQHETGLEYDFQVADWNRDGYQDLIIIKKYNTGTNSTEVHILSGALNFQDYLLHTGTPQEETGNNYDFDVADWDRDGYPDLFIIKKAETGTGMAEVHILSGVSGFQRFILNTGTAQHQTGNEYVFRIADWNGDGRPDLFGIKKNQTGTGSTEVHIVSGAGNFQHFLLHTGTVQEETGSNYDFEVIRW